MQWFPTDAANPSPTRKEYCSKQVIQGDGNQDTRVKTPNKAQADSDGDLKFMKHARILPQTCMVQPGKYVVFLLMCHCA